MAKRSFQDLLAANWVEGKFLCVGLDPDTSRLHGVGNLMAQMYDFLQQVVKGTAHLVAAFKANVAFFEEFGQEGLRVLSSICRYIKEKHPQVVLILDAKRGDVMSTSVHSANFLFGSSYQADAVTVHPYMGRQGALEPYLDRADKGVFVLCRTSNPGANEFQDLEVMYSDGRHRPLYQEVAARVAEEWNVRNNCGLVTGATAPDQLATVRRIAPHLPLLIPGVGKQGGDLEKSVRAARFRDSSGGFLINSSSGIIHPPEGTFPANVVAAAETLDRNIRDILSSMAA